MFSLHFRVCRFKKVIRGRACAAVARGQSPHCQPVARGTSAALIRGQSPPSTGGRGCKRCSGARPGPPCPPGAVGGLAAVARGQSSPWLPAAGDARASLARGRSPPADKTVFVKH